MPWIHIYRAVVILYTELIRINHKWMGSNLRDGYPLIRISSQHALNEVCSIRRQLRKPIVSHHSLNSIGFRNNRSKFKVHRKKSSWHWIVTRKTEEKDYPECPDIAEHWVHKLRRVISGGNFRSHRMTLSTCFALRGTHLKESGLN